MSERGFTLAELLLATMLTLIVVAIAFALIVPARDAFDRDGAAADLAQRLRTGLQTLDRDVRGAGAGPAIAEDLRLSDHVPVVEPMESLDPDESSIVFQAIRLITVPLTAAQGRLREATTTSSAIVRLAPLPRCSGAGPVCGFEPGMPIIVFDRGGAYELAEIDTVDAMDHALTLTAPIEGRYREHAAIAEVEVTAYGLMDDENGGRRLVKVRGDGPPMPLVDHVVDFTVDVYGAAAPPTFRRDGTPSYGPRPPPLGQDDERDSWAAGENCVTAVDDDGARVSRLPGLGVPGELVRLTSSMLSDGPWCAGTGGAFDFDADLLRVRRVDIRLRVEVASARLRGPAGYLFRRAGHASRPGGTVPDGEFRLSIAPRNLVRR